MNLNRNRHMWPVAKVLASAATISRAQEQGEGLKAQAWESGQSGFVPPPGYFLAVWPWASNLTSLSFSFLVCLELVTVMLPLRGPLGNKGGTTCR